MVLKYAFSPPKNRLYGLCLISLMALLNTSCGSDDDSNNDTGSNSGADTTNTPNTPDTGDTPDTPDMNIIEAVRSIGNLDTLSTALADADLLDTLSDESRNFTLFAAEDTSFAAWGGITTKSQSELRSLLLYHVLDSDVDQAAATASQDELAFSENGQAVSFNVDDSGVWYVNGVQVTTSDIEASNGTIHIVAEVLTPEDNPENLWTSFGIAESVRHENVPEALIDEVGADTFMRYFYEKSLGNTAASNAGSAGITGNWQASTGDVYPYQVWVPDTLTAGMPLTLILHTAGEKGDDNTSQINHKMATTWAASMEEPTILLAPQAPQSSSEWSVSNLNSLLNTMINTYDIDVDRLYINGHSFGGRGVVDMLASTEHQFAAAALFAPSERDYDQSIEQLSKTPQWYVVSEADHIVDDEIVLAFYRKLIAQ